jgi:methionyl-tRNA formyltransferase
MRIIMFGTGPFAVPTFQSLLDSKHELLSLVTRPIQDAGKRRKTSANPTRELAEQRAVSIFDPPTANDPEFVARLQDLQADLFVVCDYGEILSGACLASARLGGVNLHGSLLPKYRGAAPINWAIFNGETETGITIIHMTSKLDGGPCLAQAVLDIDPEETAADVEPKLAALGVESVQAAINMLDQWDGESPIGAKQDPALATKAPRLKKSDGQINWSRSARQIVNQIRAFQPWPGSFTNWNADHLKQPLRLIIHKADVEPTELLASDSKHGELDAGQAVLSEKNCLLVQTGEGLLSIRRIQPAGKRVMEIEEFLRGHRPAIGDRFD